MRLRAAMATVVLAAAIAWQIYEAAMALYQAPQFIPLFHGIGLELPLVTRSFIASYRYWWLVPLLFAALSADVMRRRAKPLLYFSAVLTLSVATALTLHAWLYQALSRPLATILEKVG